MRHSSKYLLVVVLGVVLVAAAGCGEKPADPAEKKSPDAKSAKMPGPAEPAEKPPSDVQPTDTPGPAEPESEVKMSCDKQPYGKLEDGTQVDQYTLTNDNGLRVKVITYGAIITSVQTPDRDGKMANVTLFCDSLADYVAGHPYFGSTVGRYANRIAKGRFTLDGTEHKLATNNDANHLHGGVKGFDKHVWKAAPLSGEGAVGVSFSLLSPDGDEGYPGNLNASVTYTLDNEDQLMMVYSAQTDRATVVNLTNHAYWNLAGAGSGDVLGHEMMLNAEEYLPVDDGLIPLGDPAAVKDTPMDFTRPKTIGSRIEQVEGGYDHCYVLNRKQGDDLTMVARVVEPESGRVMEIYTDQPAVQFYTGNFLDGTDTGGGVKYQKHFAFCLETGKYPDSPNRPEYPSTVLRPGETYEHVTIHKFTVQR